MNPILPAKHFVPDGEARQFSDGRMYLYGSYDISGQTTYCSHEYRVFSSADLIEWIHHGVSFSSLDPSFTVANDARLYAPDCIYKDGIYYLYYCQAGNGEGVAVADAPTGPFTDARPIAGADGDAIDPAVFIDDDGEAYYYWGQFHLRGARLKPNMVELDESTVDRSLITEEEHGFHEGASMRKRDGIYYLVYTDIGRGRATCLSYATSRSPLGPFTKGGVIIDNTGCDRETWNNHGSIAPFVGSDGREQWYVFYHRSSQNSRFSRRACVEKIGFDADGGIDEVEMTTGGVEGAVPAGRWIGAWRACLLDGQVRTEQRELMDDSATPDDGRRTAETVNTERPEVEEYLSQIHHGDWAAYRYLRFEGAEKSVVIEASTPERGGEVEIRLDSPDGPCVARCRIGRTGGWTQWRNFDAPIEPMQGDHAVYLCFRGDRSGRLFNLKRMRFGT